MATFPVTEGDNAVSGEVITQSMIVVKTLSDAVVSGDTLAASVSGFLVERLLSDTTATADALSSVAALMSGLSDTAVSSDSVLVTSDKGGFVVKFEGDAAASSEAITAHMVVALTIADGAVSSDLFTKPRIPRAQQSDALSSSRPAPLPLMPGGNGPYSQRELSRLQAMAENTLAMVPQAATQAPTAPLDGMKRLARSPWRPVSGQTVDSWVFYDAAAGKWVYEGTAPATT